MKLTDIQEAINITVKSYKHDYGIDPTIYEIKISNDGNKIALTFCEGFKSKLGGSKSAKIKNIGVISFEYDGIECVDRCIEIFSEDYFHEYYDGEFW